MTEDMKRMLRDASDDDGRPVGFAIDELVTHGRRRVRIRRSGFAGVAGAIVASLAIAAVAAWPSGHGGGHGPAFSTSDEDGMVKRCAALDDDYREAIGHPDSPPIDDWSIRVRQANDQSISLMLAPHDQSEVAYCRLDRTGADALDDYWRGTNISIQDAAADAANIGDGQLVWSSGGTTSEKIGRMTYKTADGQVTEAARNGRYYVWQHRTTGVDPDETVWVTFYYAHSNHVAFRVRAKTTLYSSEPPPLADPSSEPSPVNGGPLTERAWTKRSGR